MNFRAEGEDAALLTEPDEYYANDEGFLRWLASRGFAFPYAPRPGCEYPRPWPDHFIVITEAGSDPVTWLPEQDGRLKQRWEQNARSLLR